MKYKIGQKIKVMPGFRDDLDWYMRNGRKIRPYGKVTKASPRLYGKKHDSPDPFFYKVNFGDGVVLTFASEDIQPYFNNEPDDV